MIHVAWKYPNYRARVTRPGTPEGKPIWKLLHVESQDQVRQMLEARGFALHAVDTYDIRGRARTETERMMAARQQDQPYRFRPIWTELKEYLIDLFHGKCAYCETKSAFADLLNAEASRRLAETRRWLVERAFSAVCSSINSLSGTVGGWLVGAMSQGNRFCIRASVRV